MHCWADLQSAHGFRCYDNIASNAKCQRVLVLAVCLVLFVLLFSYIIMYDKPHFEKLAVGKYF